MWIFLSFKQKRKREKRNKWHGFWLLTVIVPKKVSRGVSARTCISLFWSSWIVFSSMKRTFHSLPLCIFTFLLLSKECTGIRWLWVALFSLLNALSVSLKLIWEKSVFCCYTQCTVKPSSWQPKFPDFSRIFCIHIISPLITEKLRHEGVLHEKDVSRRFPQSWYCTERNAKQML